jgi:hypothetical protein
MEFKQITDLAVLPPEIEFNFEELKKELTDGLQKYQGLVVTEDGIKDAKADRAKLNALYKAIDDKRKEIKKECMKPYDAFEKKAKVLLEMIGGTSGEIDKQIKAFDEQRKEEKKTEILQFFCQNVGDLQGLVVFDKIFNPQWLNATYSMANIEKEIIALFKKVKDDLAVINGLEGDFAIQCKDYYLKGFDLSGALAEVKRLEENAKRLAEYEARQKIAQQTEEEPKETIQQEVEQEETYIPSVEIEPEQTKTIKVIFYDTTQAFRDEMKALTIKHGTKYGGISDGGR